MSKDIKVGDLVTYTKDINWKTPKVTGVVVELTYDPRTVRHINPILCARVRWNNEKKSDHLESIDELEVISESR